MNVYDNLGNNIKLVEFLERSYDMTKNRKQEQLIEENIELNGFGYSDANGYSKIELPFHLEREDSYSRFSIKIMPKDCTDSSRVIKFSMEPNDCINFSSFEVKPCEEKVLLFHYGHGIIMPVGDYKYTLNIEKLLPNDKYKVKLIIFKDYSSMSEITNNTIQEAESENIKNSLCFTISDHILNSLGTGRSSEDFFVDKELENAMYVKINFPSELYWNDYNVPYLFKIDEDGIIRIKVITEINLFLNKTIKNPFATVKAMFLIETSPYISKGTDEFLELRFINSNIDGNPEIKINILAELQQLFGSELEFKDFTNDILKEMSSAKTEERCGDTFIILLNTISIPSNWGNIGNAKAYFEKFYFKTGYINGQQVGFLIIMFSIYSLSGCSVIKNEDLIDSSLSNLISNSKCNYQYLHNRIGIGISQNALNEIFKPFRSYILENSFEKGGDLNWRTSYWVRSGINNIEISNNGIKIQIPEVEGGGKLVARYRTGRINWWKASAALTMTFEDVNAIISIFKADSRKVGLAAKIDIGNLKVKFEVHNKQIIDLAASIEANFHKDVIENLLNMAIALTLFDEWTSVSDYPYIKEIENKWYENESVVIELGILLD